MPTGVKIKPIFDQSIFVKAALNSVHDGRADGGRTDGADDPAVPGQLAADAHHSGVDSALDRQPRCCVMYVGKQTLNTMTLGGFALAVGILVDNATVVIENIERHLGLGEDTGARHCRRVPGKSAIPTVLSTLSICIVFVPVFSAEGTAKYLFSPLSLSVIVSLMASLALIVHAGAGAVQVSDAFSSSSNHANGQTRGPPTLSTKIALKSL